MKFKLFIPLILLIFILAFISVSCANQKIKVALFTNLEKASKIGESEVSMLKLYFKLNPKSKIKAEVFNDGWDKTLVHNALNELIKRKIKFLITTHTSTAANEIAEDINKNKILNIVLGATTTNLSGKDDFHIRLINDVEEEQKKIANYINSLPDSNLLLLIDDVNKGYTFLAKEYFKNSSNKDKIYEIYFDANNFEIESIDKSIGSLKYDLAYFIVGGGNIKIAAIAQLIYKKNSKVKIVFTPWVISKKLLNLLGPAKDSAIFSSFIPLIERSEKLNIIKNSFLKEYGFYPTNLSYKIYEALQILDFAFENGKFDPIDVKAFLLNQDSIETYFESVKFDRFGDFKFDLFFSNDLSQFY
jgi:ABC-type branched-subunit amino acid transport system substrate-binding protein